MVKKIPDKIFAFAGGGLGDIYWTCLMSEWAFFEDIKTKNPKAKIHAVMSSANPLSAELVKYNPWIDKLDIIEPKDRRGIELTAFKESDYMLLRKMNKSTFKIKDSLFLSADDEKFVSIEQVHKGDLLRIITDEIIPADGSVEQGEGVVNE